MAKVERVYIIPIRREWLKTPKYRRTKKAAIAVKEFLSKHMKSDKIKLGKNLNLKLWEHGIKNSPAKIKVSVVKEDDGTVKAELFGHKFEEEVKSEKKKEAAKPVDKLKEKILGKEEAPKPKTEEKKPEVKKEEPRPEVKPAETPKTEAPKPEPKKE